MLVGLENLTTERFVEIYPCPSIYGEENELQREETVY